MSDAKADFIQLGTFLQDAEVTFNEARNNLIRGRQAEAQNFNVFTITQRSHFEVTTHSSLLAHLLDPLESHLQGGIFLKAFLSCVEELAGRKLALPNEFARWRVDVEKAFSISSDEDETVTGQLDIVLECLEPGFLLVIENKIWAQDQPGQLVRYWRWMKERNLPAHKLLLIYLSPRGKSPTELSFLDCSHSERTEIENTLILMSYKKNISSIFLHCLEEIEAPGVKEIVRQYIKLLGEM